VLDLHERVKLERLVGDVLNLRYELGFADFVLTTRQDTHEGLTVSANLKDQPSDFGLAAVGRADVVLLDIAQSPFNELGARARPGFAVAVWAS
jgi:hypothetical protein